jgi:sec-independent protein translocase protein TatB
LFDIGWSELAVIACVTILVVGPKELPGLLRTMGKTVGQLRKMAGDFQKQFDEAIREAELDDVKKTMKAPFQPLEDARKAALDFQSQVNSQVNSIGKETPATPPPVSAAALEPVPAPVAPPPAPKLEPVAQDAASSARTMPPAAAGKKTKAAQPAKATAKKAPAAAASVAKTTKASPKPAPRAASAAKAKPGKKA